MDFKEQIDTIFMEIAAGVTKKGGVLTPEERKSLTELVDMCREALTIDHAMQRLRCWEEAVEAYETDKEKGETS